MAKRDDVQPASNHEEARRGEAASQEVFRVTESMLIDLRNKEARSGDRKQPVAMIKPGVTPQVVTPGMLADFAPDDPTAAQTLHRSIDEQYAAENERSLSTNEANRARAVARRLSTMATVLAWVSAVAGLYGMFVYDTPAGFVVTLPLLLIARYLQKRRSYVLAPMNVISYDRAVSGQFEFMLFLRPFDLDARRARWDDLSFDSMEDDIVIRMARAGTVVAVGRPDERTPPPGAHRIYVPAPDWQPKVSALMQRARLVVLAVGDSDGVRWELRQAFSSLSPEKLVLFVPDQLQKKPPKDRWRSIVTIAAESGVSLPPEIGAAVFVTFDAHWKANLINSGYKIDAFELNQAYPRIRQGITAAMSAKFPAVDFRVE